MLPSRSGRSRWWGASVVIVSLAFVCSAAVAADPKADSKAKKAAAKAEKEKAKGPAMLGGIPLPIGQEVKGLVLPDYDTEGRLRARFEAGTAKRIDAERVQFAGLKMTTFTPENTIDLNVDMPEATLDLNTRVISSSARTNVARTDFSISGDTMKFDTVGRTGTLAGNVKMVINDTSNLGDKEGE
jgi:hypothetical protein